MAIVNFTLYNYIPVLSGAEVERVAFENLRPETRNNILPLFELSRHRGAVDFGPSIQLIQDFVDQPFILDLDKRIAPQPYQAINPTNPAAEAARVTRETLENDQFNDHLNALLAPTNGFENWRAVASEFPEAVPVLQYTNPIAQSNAIIRQASLLSAGGHCIALRITQAQSDLLCQIATQIIALLPSSAQLLLIFDCGQGRRGNSEKADWVQMCVQDISSQIELAQRAALSVVCMSNSFPQLSHGGMRIIENCDREIWEEACETFPLLFGDYAGSSRLNALSAFVPRSYRATVVHSQSNRWIAHRHENADDPEGWVVGSQAIGALPEFDPLDAWTDNSIRAVAAASALGNMDAPRRWHAARIAGHIERQFEYQPQDEDE